MERPKFSAIASKLEDEDVLIVTKIDRLVRNAADIDSTIEHLRTMGVRIVSLDMPVEEVTSATGDMIRRVISVFAQFEREQLVERTHAGLARANAEGRFGGRPSAVSKLAKVRGVSVDTLTAEIRVRLQNGETSRGIAGDYKVSHTTIANIGKGDA
jgi:putative DNA-invertase from lambdoid prophage Rac